VSDPAYSNRLYPPSVSAAAITHDMRTHPRTINRSECLPRGRAHLAPTHSQQPHSIDGTCALHSPGPSVAFTWAASPEVLCGRAFLHAAHADGQIPPNATTQQEGTAECLPLLISNHHQLNRRPLALHAANQQRHSSCLCACSHGMGNTKMQCEYKDAVSKLRPIRVVQSSHTYCPASEAALCTLGRYASPAPAVAWAWGASTRSSSSSSSSW